MEASDQQVKLSSQQQRVLKLLFKFRFISAQLLAQVMGISRPGVYQVLESLVEKGVVSKVYEKEFRIDRKPAYYYLNKQGVTVVRRLMNVKESVVHALYKNDVATSEFIEHCLVTAYCYATVSHSLPADTEIFTKPEINRFTQFPKNRPDLYIRTQDGHEAIIVIMTISRFTLSVSAWMRSSSITKMRAGRTVTIRISALFSSTAMIKTVSYTQLVRSLKRWAWTKTRSTYLQPI